MSSGPVAPVGTVLGLAGPARSSVAGGAVASEISFLDLVGRAIGELNASIAQADELAIRMAAGQEVDLHQVMVALETATIGLQTALQIRNRAIEAYREIMSMTI